jgi:tRNA A37 threonylcarbamoyladenosine synthetase subunit TsaC/SUA5/YrdC
LALVKALRHPIIGTSCSGPDGPFEKAADIQKYFSKKIDLILDSGPVPSEPSSVIDFTTPEPMIIRQGKGDLSSFSIREES